MKVLITAGGTSEAIDSVRSITNYSTGRLGSIIADCFAHNNATVIYVCGGNAVLPASNKVEIIRIRNVQELSRTFSKLLDKHRFDCVIHSMAVSDFTPQAMLTVDDIVTSVVSAVGSATNDDLSAIIREAVLASGKPLNGQKISSQHQDLMILLKQAPKVIKLIKTKQPETILAGFKLLSGASEEELLQAANILLAHNNCDFILANDLQNIKGDAHKAILLDKDGNIKRAATKQEIAEILYKAVSERTKRF